MLALTIGVYAQEYPKDWEQVPGEKAQIQTECRNTVRANAKAPDSTHSRTQKTVAYHVSNRGFNRLAIKSYLRPSVCTTDSDCPNEVLSGTVRSYQQARGSSSVQ